MKNNNKWYSVILILLLIWFIFLLTVWVFSLIFNETKNIKNMWDYIKLSAWAESSQEIALLEIKEKGYFYNGSIKNSKNNKSIILSDNPLDIDAFNNNKDSIIYFSNDWKVNTYSWTIKPLWYDIIPLFYEDESGSGKVTSIKFEIISWMHDTLSWNIISETSGITWVWDIDSWITRDLKDNNTFEYNSWVSVSNFLDYNESNYLVLFNTSSENSSWNNDISYEIYSEDTNEYFTKPEITITSSAKLWYYKQNIDTKINNAELLNILKYSIFSK